MSFLGLARAADASPPVSHVSVELTGILAYAALWVVVFTKSPTTRIAQDSRSDAFKRWFLPVLQYGATITCAEDFPLEMRRRSLPGVRHFHFQRHSSLGKAVCNVKPTYSVLRRLLNVDELENHPLGTYRDGISDCYVYYNMLFRGLQVFF